MSELRVQKCDNCGEWARPTALMDVVVVEKTEYIRSAAQPRPVMQEVTQMWCLKCNDAVRIRISGRL